MYILDTAFDWDFHFIDQKRSYAHVGHIFCILMFQIETESNKKVLANLEKITGDYQLMKKENEALIKKIKGKS